MDENTRWIVAVIIGTLFVLSLVGLMGLLLAVNTNRRHRYRADLAEADLRREGEVMQAEREATEQTLSEMGRELHDNVGQLLTLAQMGFLDHLVDERATDPRVDTALQALDQGIEEVRRLGRTLNTDMWRERTLVEVLEMEAVRVERIGRAHVHLVVEGDPADPAPPVKTILFRTFQEVLNNSLRHSGADTLTITVSDAGSFSLVVADNGKGFSENTLQHRSGLLNIRRRCDLIGFDARLTSTMGQGCCWSFTPRDGRGT